MKKIAVLILIFSTCTIYSQESSEDQNTPLQVEIVKNNSFENADPYGKNEIRLNLLYLLVLKTFDFSYERVLNPNSSFGVSILFSGYDLEDSNSEQVGTFSITPYYRMYFLNRRDYGSKGLFVEIFAALAQVEKNIYDDSYASFYSSPPTAETFQDVAIGVGLGKKWITRKGMNVEIFAGIGRYFINEELEAMGRFGVSLGKRF